MRSKLAFTLIELLLVIGIIAILASIVVIAINPTQQLSDAADAERRSFANQIEKAMVQYLIDEGSLPGDQTIPNGSSNAKQLCRNSYADADCINVDEIVPEYLPCMPRDGAESNSNYSGYTAYLQSNIVQISALYVEQDSTTSGSCESPTPLAYWNFDEGTGLTAADASPNSYDGDLTNMDSSDWVTDVPTTEFTNPYALDFDGSNDRIDIASFDVTGDSISIAAWFKADSFSNDERIISKATNTSSSNHYWMLGMNSGSPDELRFRLHAGGSATSQEDSTAETDTWTHVAAVYNGSSMILYKNGTNVGSTSKSGDVRTGNVDVWIGDNQPQGSRAFDGKIDDVRVYDFALSPTQVDMLASGKQL